MPTYDVVVLGLGAAGVTAASTLARAGKKVLALEATSRIGGRVDTRQFGDGVVELGAEWIHGKVSNLIYETAVENGIDLLPQDLTFDMFRSDGSAGDNALFNELTDHALGFADEDNYPPKIPENLGDHISKRLISYIEEKRPEILKDKDFINQYTEFLNLYICNYEAGNDWNDISTQSQYKELEGHQHMSWHRHGYKTFFEIMLNTYRGRPGYPNLEIKFNSEVINIDYSKHPLNDVIVTCKDGVQYSARNIIVTLSVGILKEVHNVMFTPPLPPSHAEAIEVISIGVMDKILLSFTDAWWPKEKTFFAFVWRDVDLKQIPETDRWMTKIFGASIPMGASNVVTLWTSGDMAVKVEVLPEEEVKRKCMKLLKMFMGKNIVIPEPTGILRSTWRRSLSRGSYSHDAAVQSTNARTVCREPLRAAAVVFAGEHTRATDFSTVHGAAASGKAAADVLLRPASKI